MISTARSSGTGASVLPLSARLRAYVCVHYAFVCTAGQVSARLGRLDRRRKGVTVAVTSRDVARLAGVSQPTVSRALRDDPRVSNATKRSVREAADLLGYVPSDAWRALSSGRTRRIGLLVTDLGNQFYAQII